MTEIGGKCVPGPLAILYRSVCKHSRKPIHSFQRESLLCRNKNVNSLPLSWASFPLRVLPCRSLHWTYTEQTEIRAEGRRMVKAGWEQRVVAAGLGIPVRSCSLVPGPRLLTGDEAGSVAL